MVAEHVRRRSQEAALTDPAELAGALAEAGLAAPEGTAQDDFAAAALAAALAEHDDLRRVADIKGRERIFSIRHLSESYARLLTRKESPLLLMAETVRENSALYPRPLPLDIFEEPPFELSDDEIQACLKQMADDPDFRDIACTTSSAGTIFLFSTRHLEPGYAAFLAESLDVMVIHNP